MAKTTYDDMYAIVIKVLVEDFKKDIDSLKPETELKEDLNLDSLDRVDFLCAVEAEYGDDNCEGEGTDLTVKELGNIIEQQKWVSCILFFGGEWDMMHLNKLLKTCKDLEYKTALYSGHELDWFKIKHPNFHLYLDYIKVGRYYSEYGSLDYPSTNQRLYKVDTNEDITHLFWKTNIR